MFIVNCGSCKRRLITILIFMTLGLTQYVNIKAILLLYSICDNNTMYSYVHHVYTLSLWHNKCIVGVQCSYHTNSALTSFVING